MRRLHVLSLAALLVAPAGADTITLVNGRVIQADRTWWDGTQLMYEKNGGVYGLPKTLVKTLEQQAPIEPSSDPDVVHGRERLAAGDAVGAVQSLLKALRRDPRSVPTLQSLAEAYLKAGDAGRARDIAERAVRADDRSARSRALLGDALVALGDRAGAEAQYQKSLQLHPDTDVQGKLAQIAPTTAALAQGPRFKIRYDGAANEALGASVQQVLIQAWTEFAGRLGFAPDAPVTVVLQTEEAFQEGHAPEWADGVNDGAIHVAVRGLDRPTPRLSAVLRHELAHSFISAKTGGNCPTWLQEGVSQWLEGGDPGREDVQAAAALRAGRLLPLVNLEAPFQSLREADAALAYAESLSVVTHIVRTRGEPGVVRLLLALADRLPAEEALPVALGLSYPELQRDWEQELRGLRPAH